MTLKQRRIFWFLVWLLIILSGPITVLRNIQMESPQDYVAVITGFKKTPDFQSGDELNADMSSSFRGNPAFQSGEDVINIFQRVTGLLAFSLIFAQIMLGSFMGRWVQILGARAYKAHVTQGLITYGFIFIHPIFNVIITQQSVGALSSVLSLLPNFSTQREIFLTFGRIALTLLTIGVIAAYFRTKPIFRRNWRAFHILNYLAFFLVVMHSRGVGTDIRTPPFSWFWWVALALVTGSILSKWVYPLVLRFLPVGRPSTKTAR